MSRSESAVMNEAFFTLLQLLDSVRSSLLGDESSKLVGFKKLLLKPFSKSRLIFEIFTKFAGRSVGLVLSFGVDFGYCNDRRILLTRLHSIGSSSSESDEFARSCSKVTSSVDALLPRSYLTEKK